LKEYALDFLTVIWIS